MISSIEEIIEDVRAGKMCILVDDEDRENEGDLVIPAQYATPQVIAFMARNASGLICLSLTQQRAFELGLPPMTNRSGVNGSTAFTVSIEAKEGITTGISAGDRSTTIMKAINPFADKQDVVSPGHVFPLTALDGGVLVRAGHTEASVDLASLAGLYPAGVICEIMNEDGTMARMPELIPYAQKHGLKIGTIADLIAFRLRKERLVIRGNEAPFEDSRTGLWRAITFRNKIDNVEHLALVKGTVEKTEDVLVKVHAINLFEDILGERAGSIRDDMEKINEVGLGVVVLVRNPRNDALSARIQQMKRPLGAPLREYGIGAQILMELGVGSIDLMTRQSVNLAAFDGFDIRISPRSKIEA